MNSQKTSCTEFTEWPVICAKAAKEDVVFETFRRNSASKGVVDTVSFKAGKDYLRLILSQSPELIDYLSKFRTNDDVGSPDIYGYRYKLFSPKIYFSPTTLRYIKVLSDLKKHFGNLDGMRIIEIGVGYGGQCKIISDLYNFESYTLVDLSSCLPLVKKYLDRFGVKNLNYTTLDDLENNGKYDLVISNYAFSEITRSIQDIYIEKVISKSSRGYMLCNFSTHGTKINSYSEQELVNLIDENKVMVFKKKPELAKIDVSCNISLLIWGSCSVPMKR